MSNVCCSDGWYAPPPRAFPARVSKAGLGAAYMYAATPRTADKIRSEAPRKLEDTYSNYSKVPKKKYVCPTLCPIGGKQEAVGVRPKLCPVGVQSKWDVSLSVANL